jgi:CheY-like chemotaxis protein
LAQAGTVYIATLARTEGLLVESSTTILIVDDDEDIREALHILLEQEGYSVLEAEHGEAALSLLETTPSVEIILLDIIMTPMDGFTFLEELRTRGWRSRYSILAMTAFTGLEARIQTTTHVDGVLVKPFHYIEFVFSEIARLVEQQKKKRAWQVPP